MGLLAVQSYGKLKGSHRLGPSNWQRQTVDSVSKRIGANVDPIEALSGDRVLVHRNVFKARCVLLNKAWSLANSSKMIMVSQMVVCPRAVFRSATEIEVYHGIESSSLGSERMALENYRRDWQLIHHSSIGTSIGGSSNVMFGLKALVITRQLIRGALFGVLTA